MKTIVGLYQTSAIADDVIRDLENSGVSRSNIHEHRQAESGLESTLTGRGVPATHARKYADGVSHGRALVVVPAGDDQAPSILAIMNRYNPINIEDEAAMSSSTRMAMTETDLVGTSAHVGGETARVGGESSFAGANTMAGATTASTASRTSAAMPAASTQTNVQGEAHIPVVEEELHVGKREVERGGVRVQTHVEERPVEEQVNLREEHVRVERRPIDRPATEADFSKAFQEQSIELTERAEVAVVQKEARVVEEVVVGKEATQHTETVRDTVRRTDVDVEQVNAGEFDRYETDFRTNFQSSNPGSEYTYDQAKPAYRFGYDLASRHRDRDWSSVEHDARSSWEQRSPGTWEKMKDAARYAYDRARQKTS